MNYKYCPKCGAKVNSSARFCISCGYKFKSNDVSTSHRSKFNSNKPQQPNKDTYSSPNYFLILILIFIGFVIWSFLMDSKPLLNVPPSVLAFIVGLVMTAIYYHIK